MAYELLLESDYADLPHDPLQQFVHLEGAARSQMRRLMMINSQEKAAEICLQYMSTVTALADECGVEGVVFPVLASPENGIDQFIRQVISIKDRLRLRTVRRQIRSEDNVVLSPRSKGRIRIQIRKLRAAITEGELSEVQTKRLLAKLEQLEAELDQERLGIGKALAVVAYVSAIVATSTSLLADAPDALTTIVNIIGEEKVAEEEEGEELLSLPAPPKALPPPTV